MPVSIQIEKDSGVAVVTCSGLLRFDDARQAAEELWKAPDWPGVSAVWDFRASQFDVSASDVREIARFILAHQREPPPERMTFVAPRDVDFGLARMFEAFRYDPRTSFCVFRDHYEAIVWARSQEPSAVS